MVVVPAQLKPVAGRTGSGRRGMRAQWAPVPRIDPAMPLPVWSRFSFPAALIAASLFAAGVLLACVQVAEYQPAQHPLALLGTLPGWQGGLFRWLLFVLPGLLMGISALCLPPALLATRPARISQHLLVIAALGFMLMGVVPIAPHGPLETAMRAQATAWLLWLAAVVAALVMQAMALLQAGRQRRSGAALGSALLLLVLSLLPLPWLPGPVAQLLAWAGWMVCAAVLAQVGAGGRPGEVADPD